jgi:hypothetical protein
VVPVPAGRGRKGRAGPEFSAQTSAGSGLRFFFDGYSAKSRAFVYRAYGQVVSTVASTPDAPCTMSGSLAVSRKPWRGSLMIGPQLGNYQARLLTSKAPKYFTKISCPGGASVEEEDSFEDLLTFKGARVTPRMNPTDTVLTDTNSSSLPGTTWSWRFVADIPK